MGIARSTYYDRPALSFDDTALVERRRSHFEAYGYRRMQADPAGHAQAAFRSAVEFGQTAKSAIHPHGRPLSSCSCCRRRLPLRVLPGGIGRSYPRARSPCCGDPCPLILAAQSPSSEASRAPQGRCPHEG